MLIVLPRRTNWLSRHPFKVEIAGSRPARGAMLVLDNLVVQQAVNLSPSGIGSSNLSTSTKPNYERNNDMKPVTKKQCIEIVKQIKAELPDRVNPMDEDGHSCVYHNGGRGRSIRRCMVGEVLYRLGKPLPPAQAGPFDELGWDDSYSHVIDGFTDSAKHYLGRIQYRADGGGPADPIRWGDVPVYV